MTIHTLDTTLLHVARTRLVTDYAEQVRTCLRALDESAIWWRANEKANSIGNLILHLCGSTRFYIGSAVGGVDVARDRPSEFAERTPLSRDQLIGRLDEVVAEADRILSAFDPARLMETTERTGKTTTYAQIVLHVLLHFATHTGQIVYATKILREGAIDELWMKTRSR